MAENPLTYASPESLGIPSQAVSDFLDELKALDFPMHSVLLMRHGKVAAEGYCPPFDADRKHRMYSVSKSFTSVAVGMLIDEGRLHLDDRVADFFPEYLPENPHPYILEATVRHLLTMATFNEANAYDFDSPDFVHAFFDNHYPKHKPGTIFHYDTAATTTLCAIVEKLTGKRLTEYMRPLFDELGISKDIWCIESPEGRSWTGSGILATPRDLLRFGQFCLNRGEWNGRQLVSREYMTAATSWQIDTTVAESSQGPSDGYGYQFWMLEDGGFACFGMGSQFAYMMPKYDTVLVTTADTQAMNAAGDAIRFAHYRMLKKMSDQPLPEDPAAQKALHERLHSFALPLPNGKPASPRAGEFSGVTYEFEENLFGFQWMRADFTDDACTLVYENRTGTHSFPLYLGGYKPFLFPEKYSGRRIARHDREYQCLSAGAWVEDTRFLAKVFAVDDYVGTLKIQLSFDGEDLTVFMTVAAEDFFNDYRGYLAGHAVKK